MYNDAYKMSQFKIIRLISREKNDDTFKKCYYINI